MDKQVFIVQMTVCIDESKPSVSCDDIEWAVRDLLFDDDEGVPNFIIGAVVGIEAKEINQEK